MKKVYLTLSGIFVAVGTLMASDGIDKREYHVLRDAEWKNCNDGILTDTLVVYDDAIVFEEADEQVLYVEELNDEEQIFEVVEQMPEFPGGNQGLMRYLANNLKYPRISRDNNSQGRVFVRFVINTDGSIQDVEILKSSGDMYLDREAVRLVTCMPRWKPGRVNGLPVRVRYVQPVIFRLQ